LNATGKSNSKFIWAIGILLSIIALLIVARRTLFILPILQNNYPSSGSGSPAFPEEGFIHHPLLTLIHVLPGFVFVILGLLQFHKGIRAHRLTVHRWMGRIVMMMGLIIGISGIMMGFKMAISGVSETAATTLFGSLFLFSLARGYVLIRQHNFILHREWMIRAFAIGLAVTTTRPIVGIFFATSSLTGLTPKDFFGTALWIGFTIHLIAAEVWINRTR
jgi:hypothetical protein